MASETREIPIRFSDLKGPYKSPDFIYDRNFHQLLQRLSPTAQEEIGHSIAEMEWDRLNNNVRISQTEGQYDYFISNLPTQ
jgi:hypothetical protein